jgi:hypothetical protein
MFVYGVPSRHTCTRGTRGLFLSMFLKSLGPVPLALGDDGDDHCTETQMDMDIMHSLLYSRGREHTVCQLMFGVPAH